MTFQTEAVVEMSLALGDDYVGILQSSLQIQVQIIEGKVGFRVEQWNFTWELDPVQLIVVWVPKYDGVCVLDISGAD